MEQTATTLGHTAPAGRWGEAFPLGNGHMGAMVYSGMEAECIALTENTFFSGSAPENSNTPGARDAFNAMRAELEAGDYAAAHKTARGFIGARGNYGTNLPVGALHIALTHARADTAQYMRTLDLMTGTVHCTYTAGEASSDRPQNTVRRRTFVSHPDSVMVWQISAELPFDACVHYENHTQTGSVTSAVKAAYGALHWQTAAHETMHCDTPSGVWLGGAAMLLHNGIALAFNDEIQIKAATELTVYLAMETDFDHAAQTPAQCEAIADKRVAAAAREGVDTLWQRHAVDVAEKMQRCTLELQGARQTFLTQTAFQFQYGRYLLLAASREDSRLPAHLQGIWNDNVACRIGWTCDMHLDINTQMNYWLAQPCALGETAQPLFRWVAGPLQKNGTVSARLNYGLPGWVAEIVSNAWAFTAPYWAVPIAPCPTGGVWVLLHLWDAYQITRDLAFLREQAFPVTESAVRFFVEYVFLRPDGFYSCGPSVSPENSFVADGVAYQISNGSTYEILMVRELLDVYLQMCDALGRGVEESLQARAREILPRLLPYRVLPDGTLAEWNHNYPAADTQHRHTSHLLGLFPFAQITPQKTPALAKAAAQTIRQKMTPEENWEDTGWARAMLMLYAARLQNAEEAWQHLQTAQTKLREPNGFIIHPPTRGTGTLEAVYELDGNTGLTMCVAEMLLQSQNEILHLLPALPCDWESGCVTGLCARGGVIVDLAWHAGVLTQAVLCAKHDTTAAVLYNGKTQRVFLAAGQPFVWQE